MREIKNLKKYIYISLVIILFITLFYFLPFKYTVKVVNEHNVTINATVSIYWHGREIWTKYGDNTFFYLPSSIYEVKIESYGFVPENFTMKNRIFKYKLHKKQLVMMHPIEIDLSEFEYYDPTGTVKLEPKFTVTGTTIQKDLINQTFDEAPILDFGFYSIVLSTEYFIEYFWFEGDIFDENLTILYLEPNAENIILSEEEFNYVENYFNDYLDFSIAKKIHLSFRGYPKQYYLYNKSRILSLGDMFLLLCEKEAYQKTERKPVYFLIPGKEYTVNEGGACYLQMLNGKLPKAASEEIYGKKIPYDMVELNQRINRVPVAFSYDIESGRYIHNGNKGNGISVCENKTFSMGIDKDKIDCDDADYMAWFTPTIGNTTLIKYPYPWVSGILGFEQILLLSQKYGIPSTYYIVAKEIPIYEELAPHLVKETKELVDKNLIEIGSHTFYHNFLGKNAEKVDKEQVLLSKRFLEKRFNTDVIGIRGSYLSMIGSKARTNAVALGEIGMEYSTNEPNNYKAKEGEAINKPVNFYIMTHAPIKYIRNMAFWYRYIITLDHPWNFYYGEVEENGSIYLQENSTIADNYRANVLSAISYGYIPMLVRDINVSSNPAQLQVH